MRYFLKNLQASRLSVLDPKVRDIGIGVGFLLGPHLDKLENILVFKLIFPRCKEGPSSASRRPSRESAGSKRQNSS